MPTLDSTSPMPKIRRMYLLLIGRLLLSGRLKKSAPSTIHRSCSKSKSGWALEFGNFASTEDGRKSILLISADCIELTWER